MKSVPYYYCKREGRFRKQDESSERKSSKNQGVYFQMANYNKTSSNRLVVPEAQEAMNRFKMEAANEVGVNLTEGYNGHLTSREAGSVGGQMVKKMIEAYENSIKK